VRPERVSGRPSHTTPVAPAPPRTDAELIASVRRGDVTASLELYDRLQPRIEGVVRRLLGPRDVDVDDLVQNALVEVVTSMAGYRGQSPLEAWACAIAAHTVYRHVRRRRVERRIFSEDAPEGDDAPAGASSTRSAVARSAIAHVRRHLAQMDEGRAWAFLLHDVCGFDLREMAEIMEVSTAAAQSRLVRGRKEIHERIATDPELADALDPMKGDAS
jgi:RNA polymerase sigma-70 factor (ECF subfamily)